MQRFFVDEAALRGTGVVLRGDIAHQISKVLRLRPGDEILLLDGKGSEYPVCLREIGREVVEGDVLGKREAAHIEPLVTIDLYLSLLNKPDKFEWALQKCTELGIRRIVPVAAQRSITGARDVDSKLERWGRILKEAAEQSGRVLIPDLVRGADLAEQLALVGGASREDKHHLALIPTPDARRSLKDVIRGTTPKKVSIFVGPEGGFTEKEVEVARDSGVECVNLGPRTLRAETAAVAVVAVVLYELGEMAAH